MIRFGGSQGFLNRNFMAKSDFEVIMAKLEKLAGSKDLNQIARFGINTERALGISMLDVRKIAKEFKKDHGLAKQLWSAGTNESRILASFLDEPEKVSGKQMEEWVKDFNSWHICDQVCDLFERTKFAYDKAIEWGSRQEEFVKRAGFALIAGLTVHDKKAPDSKFEKFFPLIKKESCDDRNFIKKAVNWALRNLGKLNLNLNKKAIKITKEIQKMNCKSAKWIAADALKELNSKAVQDRLKKKSLKKS